MTHIALAALAVLLAGCAAPSVAPPGSGAAPVASDTTFASLDDYRQQRAAVVAELTAEIGDPTAGAVRSCRVLALGERPCGGPDSFLAYSTEVANVPTLLGLANRVATLDQRATTQFELASTCEMRIAPPAQIRDGRCVLAE